MERILSGLVQIIVLTIFYIVCLYAISWLVAWGWNEIVVPNFSIMPTVETIQVMIIIVGLQVTRKIIKWW